MKKALKILNFVIAGFAIAVFSLFIIETLIETLDIIKIFDSSSGVDIPIYIFKMLFLFGTIPFVAIELKHAITLIKQGKANYTDNSISTIISILICTIGIFAMRYFTVASKQFFISIDYDSYFDLKEFLPGLCGIILLALPKTIRPFLKRNKYGKRAIFAASLSLVTLIYCLIKGESATFIPTIVKVFCILTTLLIMAYSIVAIVYYFKNTATLRDTTVEATDYDVLCKIDDEKQRVKVYQKRSNKDFIPAMVLYCVGLGILLIYALIVFISTKNTNFIISTKGPETLYYFSNFFSLGEVLVIFSLLPYVILSVLAFINKESLYYKSIFSISYCGIILLLPIMSLLFKYIDMFSHDTSVDPPLGDLAMFMFLFTIIIATTVLNGIAKKNVQTVEKNVNAGGSFYGNIGCVRKATLLSFIATCILTFGLELALIVNKAFSITALMLFISVLLIFIATILHEKHPLEESYVANMKIADAPVEEIAETVEVEDEEEYAEAIPVEDDELVTEDKENK